MSSRTLSLFFSLTPLTFLFGQSPGKAVPFPPPPDQARSLPPNLFHAPDGLEVTVWASSPLFYNPTNLETDAKGRIWVAEGVNYRGRKGQNPGGDRIMVLEDKDADGKADSSHVFVQETALIAPLGIAVFDNVVVVSQPPDLIVYTDTNRNAVFDPGTDKREVLLTGFNGQNHDHSLHSVTGGPDGFWYWNQGNTGAKFKDNYGREFRIGSPYKGGGGAFPTDPQSYAGEKSDDGNVWVSGFAARMQPDGRHLEIIGHGFRNSYEQVVSSFGDVFQNDNDDPPACRVTHLIEGGFLGFCSPDGKRTWKADVRPGQTTPTAEWRQDDPHTIPAGDIYGGGAPTGIAFYENGALGEAWQGTLLSCETGRNVVFGYKPTPQGAGFKLERFDFLTTNKTGQFAGSDFVGGGKNTNPNDVNNVTHFRPSDVVVGADGALYISDWFDARTGGHSAMDGSYSGTIYRVAPKGFKPSVVKQDLSAAEGQLAALRSPAQNVRWTGWKALQSGGEKSLSAVKNLIADKNPLIASRGIWLLPHLGKAGLSEALQLIDSGSEQQKLVAFRALRRAGSPEWMAAAAKLAKSASPACQAEAAVSMRSVPWEKSSVVLTQLATAYNGNDRSYLAALALGATGKSTELYAALAAKAGKPATWSPAMAQLAWKLMAPDSVPAQKERALQADLGTEHRKLAIDAIAFVETKVAAEAMVNLAASMSQNDPLRETALWWLNNRKDNLWSAFGIPELAAAKNITGMEGKSELADMLLPAPTPEQAKALDKAAILALKGDVERGKIAAQRCISCHKLGNGGIDHGPSMVGWGLTQPPEVICEAIIDPSKTIALGFDGVELITKKGQTLQGIITENAKIIRIRGTGGMEQKVNPRQVKSQKPLGRSLMLSAAQLGLTPQEVADIISYLRDGAK